MSEPRTAAGRRLFTDNEPMDMLESDGVTWDDILAIEAEAAEGLRAILQRVVDEYDEDNRRSPSFVTIDLARAALDDR